MNKADIFIAELYRVLFFISLTWQHGIYAPEPFCNSQVHVKLCHNPAGIHSCIADMYV